eukprot:909760-Prorocentrum_minimum.AAC.6
MARLAKGMDPLGLSEPDSDSDEGSEEEEDTKVVEAKKPKQVDFETLSQFGYKRSSGRSAKEESDAAEETAEVVRGRRGAGGGHGEGQEWGKRGSRECCFHTNPQHANELRVWPLSPFHKE